MANKRGAFGEHCRAVRRRSIYGIDGLVRGLRNDAKNVVTSIGRSVTPSYRVSTVMSGKVLFTSVVFEEFVRIQLLEAHYHSA